MSDKINVMLKEAHKRPHIKKSPLESPNDVIDLMKKRELTVSVGLNPGGYQIYFFQNGLAMRKKGSYYFHALTVAVLASVQIPSEFNYKPFTSKRRLLTLLRAEQTQIRQLF